MITVRQLLLREGFELGGAVFDGIDVPVEEAVEHLDATLDTVGWGVYQHVGLDSNVTWEVFRDKLRGLLEAGTHPVETAGSEKRQMPPSRNVDRSGRSWGPVELAPFLNGTHAMPTPTVLRRSDAVGLFYPGEVHSLVGECGVGKGGIALHAAEQEIATGGRVLYVDFEEGPASITARLVAVGVAPLSVLAHFLYVRPEVPLTLGDASDWLNRTVNNLAPTLVVIDGVTEAMVLHGLDPSSNPDAAQYLMMLPRSIADRDCAPAIVLLDHPTKERDRQHRFALGAQHKRAGTAVTYIVEASRPIEKGRDDGLIRISVAKDRHGAVQAAGVGRGMPKLVAELHVAANGDGTEVEMSLEPPGAASSQRMKALQTKVRRYLTEHPGASQNGIVKAVTGNAMAIREALMGMIEDGEIRIEEEGQTRHHYLVPVDGFGNGVEPVGRQGLFT